MIIIGKNIQGKELGVGIHQDKKTKKYIGRVTNSDGKRIKRVFDKLSECRRWVADAQYNSTHNTIFALGDMTVSTWFDYWIKEIKGKTLRPNTIRNYSERFDNNVRDFIGDLLLSEVKPLHCQNILNQMSEGYRSSTIKQTSITMYGLFESAVENELIIRNPMTKAVKCTSGKPSKPKRVLTVQEQKLLLNTLKGTSNYNQYAFLLQTGLRTGEMIGLTWNDVDFKNKVIHIRRSMEYRYSVGEWRIGPPKSSSGLRDVPLTKEAVSILKDQQQKLKNITPIAGFEQYVFLSRKGEPTKNSTYDTKLVYYCDKAGIERCSMHSLRHTFATRCIEGGMRPKSLQVILGHSNIGITMNLYVHVTDEEKQREIESIEDFLAVN